MLSNSMRQRRRYCFILYIFIFIHQNGRDKYNNTKTIKSERKIEANNLAKEIKTCKPLPIQFMIYSSMNQIDIEQ